MPKKLLGFFLALYIFSLPLSISIIESSSLILSVFCIYFFFTEKGFFKSVDLRPILWFLSPFVVWGIGTSLSYTSYEWPLKLEMIKNHANLTFLYFLPALLWPFWTRLPAYSKYMVVLVGGVSLYGLLQFFTGWAIDGQEQFSILKYGDQFYYRVRGFFNNTMTYNYVMVAFFYWLYFDGLSPLFEKLNNTSTSLKSLLFQAKKALSPKSFTLFASVTVKNLKNMDTFSKFFSKSFKYICLCLLSLSLILTLTRSFLVFLPLVLLVLTFFFYGYKPFLYTLAVFVLVGAGLYSTSLFQNRFSSNIKQDHSLSYRFHFWRVHWKMFLESPWVGQGLSQKVSDKYLRIYYKEQSIEKTLFSHAHNNILSVLAGMGIVGLLAYTLMMGYFLYLALALYRFYKWKSPPNQRSLWEKNLLRALLAFMLTFHLGGLLESNFLDGEPLHMLMLGFSMLLVLRQQTLKPNESL